MTILGFHLFGENAKQDTTATPIKHDAIRSSARAGSRSGVKVLWQRPRTDDTFKNINQHHYSENLSLQQETATMAYSVQQQRTWLGRGEALGRMFITMLARMNRKS